jgi:flagellar biosynthesis protein FlhF
MNARKFIAVNSREALKMVRVELGADAVILSNRKVADGVEIVAMGGAELSRLSEMRQPEAKVSAPKAVPTPTVAAAPQVLKKPVQNQAEDLSTRVLNANNQREAAAAKREIAPAKQEEKIAAPSPEDTGMMSEIKTMHNMMQEQLACMAWSDMQHRDPKRSTLMREMLNVGFSSVLSRQLLEKMPANADKAWVQRVLGHNIRVASAAEDVVTLGGVYALVGPTGVGKTTTTAKLAARAVVRYGADKVALITTDSYRIGALEQLKIYGKILGVAVHAVRDTEDLKMTLAGLKHKHLVLIDTMGVGQRDSRVSGQAEMFNAAGVKRLLLLNATSAGGTLDDVVRMYHGAGVIGCIPTKLDEAVTLGTVLDVVVRHKLVMHYIASGQRVPEDLHEVKLDYLLHRAFKVTANPTPFEMQELEFPAFMAGSGAAPTMRADYVS